MMALRIFYSRSRVRLAGMMVRTGWRIIEAEELRWGLRSAGGWRVPNTN